jgi:hypothetical protein
MTRIVSLEVEFEVLPRRCQLVRKDNPMRAIIDESVPSASTYYKTYLAEPSPAGDMILSADSITTFDHLDLKKLLTEMMDVGPGGELLVVTHSSPTGFLMKLWPDAGSSLLFSLMDKIQETAEGLRRREAIRPLPGQQAPEAWQKWFGEFDPGIKLERDFATNPAWQKYVEKQFDRWFEERGKVVLKLRHGVNDLKELLVLLNSVRQLGFNRIEFRACQIGADKKAMVKIAEFLKVKTVVGPKNVQTFYGSIPFAHIKFIPNAGKRAAALKALGGRKFGSSLGILMLPHGARIVAESSDALIAFIKKFINSKFSDGRSSFFKIGGLNSVGSGAVQFVFPLETEYKNLLEQLDVSASGSVVP